MINKTDSFLGANTPSGFVSLFDELYDPYKESRMYIIKGGPGTGKSSFMKKIANTAIEKGLETEFVHCSSDPDSLDAVIIPSLSFAIADGTSPHIVEPKFPGAVENIINLGMFWDQAKMHDDADEIRRLTLENSIYHRRSSRFLSAAGTLIEESARLFGDSVMEEKLNGFAVRFCMREFPKKKSGKPGSKKLRFLSGITPKGVMMYDETFDALSSRVIAIEDEYSCIAGELIERIGEGAVKNGYDVIFCPCPMKPKSYCEHIIIPEASLSIITLKSQHKTNLKPNRTIHTKRFMSDDVLRKRKNRLDFNRKLTTELIGQSVEMLKNAKTTHDELEAHYIDKMNFDLMKEFTDEFIEKLFQ